MATLDAEFGERRTASGAHKLEFGRRQMETSRSHP
jgi:hypothetical protein